MNLANTNCSQTDAPCRANDEGFLNHLLLEVANQVQTNTHHPNTVNSRGNRRRLIAAAALSMARCSPTTSRWSPPISSRCSNRLTCHSLSVSSSKKEKGLSPFDNQHLPGIRPRRRLICLLALPHLFRAHGKFGDLRDDDDDNNL